MTLYRVLEQHFGDKQYWQGDTREMEESEAAELLTMGLLEEINPADEAAAAKEAVKQAKKEAKAAEQAAKEAAEQQQQPENGGTANGEKALTGDLLDKAQGGAPQNKAQQDGNA